MVRIRFRRIAAFLISLVSIGFLYLLYPPSYDPPSFLDGREFAFTIVDDSDAATLENVRSVYAFLDRFGLRTTKTVWVRPTNDPDDWANFGDSLENEKYRAFIVELQSKGFEIASHGARGGSSTCDEVLSSMEFFRDVLGQYPKLHVNHNRNLDNLYRGKDKFGFPPFRWAYGVLSSDEYYGHDQDSDHFWGDFVQRHVQYIQNFSFHDINVMKVNPSMPYHETEKRYVNYWYHTSDGGDVESFNRLLSTDNLDRLAREGGVSIVYTHFGKGFYQNGQLDKTFRERIEDLGSRNGWYVTASELLDYIRMTRNGKNSRLTYREKARLELLWIWEKMRHGRS